VLGECQGGLLPPKILPAPQWPPKISSLFVGLFLKVLHRSLTAPLVAKLAPPVTPPNENVWLRPWIAVTVKTAIITEPYLAATIET